MTQTQAAETTNVLESPFNGTVHNTAPFSKISNKDYEPAIDLGIEKARKEIDAIVNNPAAPTFDNTIVGCLRKSRK